MNWPNVISSSSGRLCLIPFYPVMRNAADEIEQFLLECGPNLRRKGGFLAKAGAFSTNQLGCGVSALLKTRSKKARIHQEKSRMEWEAMANEEKRHLRARCSW
jgi:hypothetical protein